MKLNKSLQQRVRDAVSEKVAIAPYDPRWPRMYEEEAGFLRNKFPKIIKRIEHFGSTSVPNLSAKPVVDMLIEITNFKEAKKKIVPVLKSLGYDYFWRPIFDRPPMYIWFIKRDASGQRTHHLHMVEANSELWDRLYFRDYLRKFPKEAEKYGKLKTILSKKYPNDREGYAKGKKEFIDSLTEKAKRYYNAT